MKKKIFGLYVFHIINDGFYASLLLLLPFIAKDLGFNLTKVGFLGSSTQIFQVLLSLPAGYLALKFGGSRMLLASTACIGLGFLVTSLAPSYLFLIIAFLLAGIGFGLFHPVAFSLISKLTDKSERGKQMGNFTAIGDLGRMGISSLITFIIVFIGWRTSSLLHFLIIFLVVIAAYYLFSREKNLVVKSETISHIKLSEFFKNRKFILTLLAGGLDSFASSALFIFLPFLLLKRGISPAVLGSFTAFFFLGAIMGKLVLGRLADKFGNANVFIFSEILMAIFIVLLANSTSIFLIIISSIILGIFTKGTAPVIHTMISQTVDKSFEKAFGLSYIVLGIGNSLAPIVLGYFSDTLGIVYAFGIAAVFALLATIPAITLHLGGVIDLTPREK